MNDFKNNKDLVCERWKIPLASRTLGLFSIEMIAELLMC